MSWGVSGIFWGPVIPSLEFFGCLWGNVWTSLWSPLEVQASGYDMKVNDKLKMMMLGWRKKTYQHQPPFEEYESKWESSPNRGENGRNIWQPPPRQCYQHKRLANISQRVARSVGFPRAVAGMSCAKCGPFGVTSAEGRYKLPRKMIRSPCF